jgi:hypothetical protein
MMAEKIALTGLLFLLLIRWVIVEIPTPKSFWIALPLLVAFLLSLISALAGALWVIWQ